MPILVTLRKKDNYFFTITVPEGFVHHQFEPIPVTITDLTVDQIKELTGGNDMTGFQRQEDGTYNADASAMERIRKYQERKDDVPSH